MARITIEDCLQHVENMYELVLLATQRSRQLYKGSDPLVRCKNKQIVTSLREVAQGKVKVIPKQSSNSELDEDDLSAIAN